MVARILALFSGTWVTVYTGDKAVFHSLLHSSVFTFIRLASALCCTGG